MRVTSSAGNDIIDMLQVYNLPPPSLEMQQVYEKMESLPVSVLRQAIVPRTENDANSLVQVFLGEDRVGPANTRRFDPEGVLKQALAGPDATPPPPLETDIRPNEQGRRRHIVQPMQINLMISRGVIFHMWLVVLSSRQGQ